MSRQQAGFTLLETLVAVAVFALIAVIAYGVIGTAGEGFRRLSEIRDVLEQEQWIGRQLRLDVSYVALSQDQEIQPVKLKADQRGSGAHDQLWLTVRELGQPTLSEVHYFIDEEKDVLVREAIMPWARDGVESIRWVMGAAKSFDVQVLNTDDSWEESWGGNEGEILPKALKVTLGDEQGERDWTLPVFVEEPEKPE